MVLKVLAEADMNTFLRKQSLYKFPNTTQWISGRIRNGIQKFLTWHSIAVPFPRRGLCETGINPMMMTWKTRFYFKKGRKYFFLMPITLFISWLGNCPLVDYPYFCRTRTRNHSRWSTSSIRINPIQWLHLLDRLESSQHRESRQNQWEEQDTYSGPFGFCDGYIGLPFFTSGWLEWLCAK